MLWKKVGLLRDIKRLNLSDLFGDDVLDAWCEVSDYFDDTRERSICVIKALGMWDSVWF